jgi:hypothetical protein
MGYGVREGLSTRSLAQVPPEAPHWDDVIDKQLSALGPNRDVERVFEIGRGLAQAELLLLKG